MTTKALDLALRQNSGPLAGFRNHIINGGLDIWQRGVSFGGYGYTADRTVCGVGSHDRSTDVPTNQGFVYSLQTYRAGNQAAVYPSVELPVTGNAGPFQIGTTWTFSFWYKAATGLNQVNANFRQGPVIGTATKIDGWNNPPASNGSWVRVERTFTVNVTPGGSDQCVTLFIQGTTNEAFKVTGLQLEAGPVATPFEHRPVGVELALCQRYYETGRISLTCYADTTGTSLITDGQQSVTKRAVPTVSFETYKVSQSTNHNVTATASSVNLNCNSTTTSGIARVGAYYTLDAEL